MPTTTTTTNDITTKRQIERATKLVTEIEKLDLQRGELMAELGKVLHGEQAMGDLLKIAYVAYIDAWQRRYKAPYSFTFVKDAPQMKRLIKALGIKELTARIDRFVRNGDPFFLKARHGFNVFVSTVNQHTVASDGDLGDLVGVDSDEPAPSDCRHTPRCETQAACTKATIAERRAWQQ